MRQGRSCTIDAEQALYFFSKHLFVSKINEQALYNRLAHCSKQKMRFKQSKITCKYISKSFQLYVLSIQKFHGSKFIQNIGAKPNIGTYGAAFNNTANISKIQQFAS